MTEKEKAKAYDEALKKASAAHKDEDRHLKATLERIFSELKESEDEKIKRILHAILDKMNFHLHDIFTKEEFQCFDAWSNAWLKKQGAQAPSQTNERAWLYLVSDVLTWKDGIGQYLDDPRVQELAKKLCSEYSQKLYNPSDTGKDAADKIEPRFKVGDKIVNNLRKYMGGSGTQGVISEITDDKYIFTDGSYIFISNQDSWELVSGKKPKFDPKTLQPFDKVLTRDNKLQCWMVQLFSHIIKGELQYPYSCINISYKYCIPYNEDTKHLVDTTEEAPEFYRYWED